jgi:DNA-directed RNA polymerase subunit RPC12/RpoP
MQRKGYGVGKGQGYKNLIKGYDRRIHQMSGKGVKQPQRLSTLKRKASLRLVKGLRRWMTRCDVCGTMFDKKRHIDCPRCQHFSFVKEDKKLYEPAKFVIYDNGEVIHTSNSEETAFRWLQKHPAFRKNSIHQIGRFKINKVKGGKCTPSQLKHGTDPDRFFSKSQLKQGVRTELEHTNDKSLAKAIAKAHLSEDKAYYTKLKRARL